MTPKLPEVETAKALMTEAMTWSVVNWLREKRNVRKAADLANAALDQLDDNTRRRWGNDLKRAYGSLLVGKVSEIPSNGKDKSSCASDHANSFIKQLKEADDEAYHARMDAEETFDRAERELSTRLARQGCEKALRAWDLKEKAIKKAEAISPPDKQRSNS